HDSEARCNAPRCLADTRVAVLNKLMKWTDSSDPDPHVTNAAIMWFYGPAGSGKTAIAQTLAQKLVQSNLLLADYFFSKQVASMQDQYAGFVATLAYQIAANKSFPSSVRSHIYTVVNRDPLIFTRTLEVQLKSLIVEPLQPLFDSGYISKRARPHV
ncbi:hypothetical protein CPB84DRAFT_1688459, partial [Gymnopilus junonius]